MKSLKKPRMDDQQVDETPLLKKTIKEAQHVKIPTEGLCSDVSTVYHVGVVVKLDDGKKYIIDRMNVPNKVRLLRYSDSRQNQENWIREGNIEVKPGLTLEDAWDAASEGGGYRLHDNNCVHTRDRVTKKIDKNRDSTDESLHHVMAGGLSGAKKDSQSQEIARTAPENFLNNSRGLPVITQLNMGFEAIAPESSPERLAKSLPHSFFVVPCLSWQVAWVVQDPWWTTPLRAGASMERRLSARRPVMQEGAWHRSGDGAQQARSL